MYRIQGLERSAYRHLLGLGEDALAEARAMRVTASADRGFPCRMTLEDAKTGDALILFNHVSNDVETPYRSSYAVYVREAADTRAIYEDAIPPVFQGRPLGLRGFDADGMLRAALLAMPGQAEAKIIELFGQAEIATIHAHNAAHGCFIAKIERN